MDHFEKLLERVKQNPIKADYTALRMAYTQSPHFNPYMNGVAVPAQLRQAMQTQDPALMLAGIEKALDIDFMDIEAHIYALNVLYRQGREARGVFHDLFAQGLLQSIMVVDGRSYETAFKVISIREEYAVVGVMGLQVQAQRKCVHEGANFDILTVKNPKTGTDVEYYFNIDLMRSHFDQKSLDQQP